MYEINDPAPPPREPAFNAPWPALLLTVAIAGSYLLQTRLLDDAGVYALALVPARLQAGEWGGLVTSIFLHGGWMHVLLNSAFALAFGTPISRLLGLDLRGAALLLVFFLLCGVGSGAVYALIHAGSMGAVIGASGAVSGMMGAAARLMDRAGHLGPILSPSVMSTGAAWIIVNLLVALFGLTPGTDGAGVAWEAHLAGFAIGLLLIGPVAALARRRNS
ncbi:rhomboid family intramembrane serine protease [Caulobacter sp. NIBR2454]|uniref:rhomboid family intramembrane serine protease n=1 Tax=Caulobacter sp. NIBR2454 TaxID=3015996 RepID=UPI0022B6E65E|nr:rhomboid family intramembrane serine protease [Caulobacter sp. NIBR2454]